MGVETVVVEELVLELELLLVPARELWRPFAANWRRASTGSGSSPSVGGRGKGGVKVGDGQDQEVP